MTGSRPGGDAVSTNADTRKRLQSTPLLPFLLPSPSQRLGRLDLSSPKLLEWCGADRPGHHVESVLKDVPVADRCDCPHVPIVDLPGLRLMKTVKKDPNYAGGASKKPEL
ncbi:hypothetical protein A1Q2_00459 [Trichosporon asahii var. asahii CBS 8904]|uniref:Uncharacterized protein n=1 Tax=Trichosporon asahii var. asahii (strain CBS 8904) TaxID=1220162 RepID=K1WWZ3_TRIAC|nr:hypothetical protein A1Q2_00459 [Trichosporon asahii var. asahii CBS 8904]